MLNFPGTLISFGKYKTPPQTSTKAKRVPILVRSVISLSSTTNTGSPDKKSGDDRRKSRRFKTFADLAECRWKQSVATHAHPDPGLSDLKYQQHGGGCNDGADGNHKSDLMHIDLVKDIGQRIGDKFKFFIVHQIR